MRILALLAPIFLLTCSSPNQTHDAGRRIHYVERGVYFDIVEVDGHQYLAHYHGGVVHLESCCK